MATGHLRLVKHEEQQSRLGADRDMAAKLGSLISRGLGEGEIRRVLSLSRKRYEYLCRLLTRQAEDRSVVWGKFDAATRNNIKRLDDIARRALSGIAEMKTKGEDGAWKKVEVSVEPDLRVALKAITEMQKIEERRVEIGQSLGIYPSKAEDEDDNMKSFLSFFVSGARKQMFEDHPGEIPIIEPEYEVAGSHEGAAPGDRGEVPRLDD